MKFKECIKEEGKEYLEEGFIADAMRKLTKFIPDTIATYIGSIMSAIGAAALAVITKNPAYIGLMLLGVATTAGVVIGEVSLQDGWEKLTDWVQGKTMTKSDLDKLVKKEKELLNDPTMKKYKGKLTAYKNSIKKAIEEKDWSKVGYELNDWKKYIESK